MSLGFERGGQKRKAAVTCVGLVLGLGSAELGSNFFLEGIEVGSFGATRWQHARFTHHLPTSAFVPVELVPTRPYHGCVYNGGA